MFKNWNSSIARVTSSKQIRFHWNVTFGKPSLIFIKFFFGFSFTRYWEQIFFLTICTGFVIGQKFISIYWFYEYPFHLKYMHNELLHSQIIKLFFQKLNKSVNRTLLKQFNQSSLTDSKKKNKNISIGVQLLLYWLH